MANESVSGDLGIRIETAGISTFPSKRGNAEEALGHLTALIEMLQLSAYSKEVISHETIESATALMQQQLNDIRLGLTP